MSVLFAPCRQSCKYCRNACPVSIYLRHDLSRIMPPLVNTSTLVPSLVGEGNYNPQANPSFTAVRRNGGILLTSLPLSLSSEAMLSYVLLPSSLVPPSSSRPWPSPSAGSPIPSPPFYPPSAQAESHQNRIQMSTVSMSGRVTIAISSLGPSPVSIVTSSLAQRPTR